MQRLLAAALIWAAMVSCALAQGLGVGGNSTYPSGAIPLSASSGNVAAATATATLPASPGRTTYICGFTVTAGGSTAAATVNVTVTNTPGGTLTYNFSTSTGVDAPSPALVEDYVPCLPANAQNTTIVVSMPTLGAANAHAAINVQGYQF